MLDSVLSFAHEQRAIIHLFLHALVPLVVAYCFVPKHKWQVVFMILLATMAVDIDHLLADPIYAPNRCSILFHPLHTLWPMVAYTLMMLWPVLLNVMTRPMKPYHQVVGWVGLGLVIHMLLDWLDCLWMKGV